LSFLRCCNLFCTGTGSYCDCVVIIEPTVLNFPCLIFY
jgi:hypothetical protein